MKNFFAFLLFVSCLPVLAQPVPDWPAMHPFDWMPGILPDSGMQQITAIKVVLNIEHSWGQGHESYVLEYRLRDSLFIARTTRYENAGRLNPPDRKGEGAIIRDSLFQRYFHREPLFRILRSIQQPSPYWNETDFGYTGAKFRTDLSLLPRSERYHVSRCDDCDYYVFAMQFLGENGTGPTLGAAFDTGFRLPTIRDTAIRKFQIRSMLEWMYLYQLSHLFFPENMALNQTHFPEKSMEDLRLFARQFFPALNN